MTYNIIPSTDTTALRFVAKPLTMKFERASHPPLVVKPGRIQRASSLPCKLSQVRHTKTLFWFRPNMADSERGPFLRRTEHGSKSEGKGKTKQLPSVPEDDSTECSAFDSSEELLGLDFLEEE